MCQGASTCLVHLRVPWQAVLNSLLIEDSPEVICIWDCLTGCNIHAYMQHMLYDNAGSVVLYSTVEEAKHHCFPTAAQRPCLCEVKLAIVDLPFYSDAAATARTSRHLSTILWHLDCEFLSSTQFLCIVH